MDALALGDGPWRLTLPEGLFARLDGHLFPGDNDEHGAVIACGVAVQPDGSVRLLARDLFVAVDGKDYVAGKRGYRMLKAEFIRDRIASCRDERLAYLAVHNHGGLDSVAFSGDDLQSHERGYPALLDIAKGMPVGALVFARNAVAGDIWLPAGRRVPLQGATVIGRRRRVLTASPTEKPRRAGPRYDRQARLFGDAGQDILRRCRVAIIGVGGVGMLLAQYLALLGVGSFVLIDPQRVEPSNLPRLPGATRWDALTFLRYAGLPAPVRQLADRWSSPKVTIARRLIKKANPRASVEAIRGDFLDQANAARVLDCDYLFLAADTMSARLLFNQIVHQHYIPGVQVGSKVTVMPESGAVGDVFSVVRPVTPESGCLWCNQIINPAKLQEEAQTESERRAQRYVDDPDVIAPSVVTLNAIGAAHAANDFLFYMTGMMAADAPVGYLRHMVRRRETRLIMPAHDESCPECSHVSKSRLGRGNGRRLFTRQL
jgi:molybdopterin/thiamine biosynthesis adenylyltransferase